MFCEIIKYQNLRWIHRLLIYKTKLPLASNSYSLKNMELRKEITNKTINKWTSNVYVRLSVINMSFKDM